MNKADERIAGSLFDKRIASLEDSLKWQEELAWRLLMKNFVDTHKKLWMAVYKNSTCHYFKGNMLPKTSAMSACSEKVAYWGEWVLFTEVPEENKRCNDCYKIYLLDQLGE